jgi:glycosyltransferase involved in cell wall biosynthesis
LDRGRPTLTKPRVSFIIPVRNDAARLEVCLRSVHRNSHAPGQIEIVVVDNGSTDGSSKVALAFGAKVVPVEAVRVSELRNRGARHATADVFAFVDADHEIVAGWVYAALDCLQMPTVGACGALCHAPADGTWVQRGYGHLRGAVGRQQDVDWLGSGNMAVRRQAFEALGGFDASLDTCEDVDLCHRLRAQGFRVLSDARLRNIHYGDPRTLRDVLASERWRGRDNLRVTFRRPIAWASVPSAVLPVLHIALLAVALIGLLAAPVIGRAGLLVAAAAFAGVLAATTLHVIRAALRAKRVHFSLLVQTFAVACAYDVGRALAVVSRAPHRAIRARSVAATS